MTNCVNVTSNGVLIHQRHLIWEEFGSDWYALFDERCCPFKRKRDEWGSVANFLERSWIDRQLSPSDSCDFGSWLRSSTQSEKLFKNECFLPLPWATETVNPVEAGGLFSTFPMNFGEDFRRSTWAPSCNGRSGIDSRGTSRPMTSFLSWITVLHDPNGPWPESSRRTQTKTASYGRCWSDSRVARSSDLSTSCA